MIEVNWSNEYSWARSQISIDELGSRPEGFKDILNFGDLVYLKTVSYTHLTLPTTPYV